MGISGAKKDMRKGGGLLNNVWGTLDNGRWEERSPKNGGDEYVAWIHDVIVAGEEEPKELSLRLGKVKDLGEFVHVNEDGQLVTVDDDTDYQISENSSVMKFCNSLEDHGVSATKLANIGDEPNVLSGLKVHIIQRPQADGRTDDKGRPYTDTVVDEVAKPGKGGSAASASGKASSTSAKTGAKKASKPAPVEDDEDEEDDTADDEDETDEEEVDPVDAAAITVVETLLATPKKYISTYDADENDGGITTVQIKNASFKVAKGKDKAAVATRAADKAFLKAGAAAGRWSFDAKNGVVSTPL